MDQKIGIVTWYKNGNYGGTLQAYALNEILNAKGFYCEFIDYSPGKKSFIYPVIRMAKDIIIFLNTPKVIISRRKIYKFIKDNLHESKLITDYKELELYSNNYIAVICGSDQIWSQIASPIASFYYLDFVDSYKKISYAPSIGRYDIPSEYVSLFAKYVEDFIYLSVREKKGAELISKYTKTKSVVVLDPSFLLTKDEWFSKVKYLGNKEEYIFCYFLKHSKKYLEFANKLSIKTGFKLISVSTKRDGENSLNPIAVSPLEFVALICNAKYVLTDSFHGIVFSTIFEKRFGVFMRFEENDPESQNSRVDNIISLFKLKNVIINMETSIEDFINSNVNYEIVSELLKTERMRSLDFLNNAIDKIIKHK